MESGQATQENSDQLAAVVCSSDDQQGQISQPRSYECTFCKRGFSNAQALGGHMNIHRKDKAKLKKASNQQHINIPPKTPHQDHEKGTTYYNKWNWILSSEDSSTASSRDTSNTHHVGEEKQLPFFADSDAAASTADNQDEEKGLLYSGGILSARTTEVDLELRLGHEPPKSSFMATRKFF